MYCVNEHIKKHLLNEYRGSERKDTIILDDGYKYLLKMPDPTRDLDKKELLSYINNTFSEYLGCHIAAMMGFSVQDTILGEYFTENSKQEIQRKIVCLCRDVRNENEKMIELDTISLSSGEDTRTITFETQEKIFEHILKRLGLSTQQKNQLREFYYQLFIFDAFIGNTDRHNGNLAILVDSQNTFSRISPIYDCGSSLLPLISDSQIAKIPITSLSMSVSSVICNEAGQRIRYDDYLLNFRNKDVDKALQKMIPRICLSDIFQFIDSIDLISEERKNLYKQFLQIRYNKILLPALKKALDKQTYYVLDMESDNLYQLYLDKIKPITRLECNKAYPFTEELSIMRINKKYALLLSKEECVALLPIHSNTNAIKEASKILHSIGIDILKDEVKIDYDCNI